MNGTEVGDSTVIFPGDSLETKPGFVANLDAEGSSVLIQPESIVKFQHNFVTLEHGGISVGTSTSMSVHVNCIKVEPVSPDRTQYDVTDTSGSVHVAAHKSDVNITQGGALRKASEEKSSGSATVHEGQRGDARRIDRLRSARTPRSGEPWSQYEMARDWWRSWRRRFDIVLTSVQGFAFQQHQPGATRNLFPCSLIIQK